MGQYFFVVNLDKKTTFGCFGKFGEFFFHGLGQELTYHLQRRLTPPLDPLPNGGKQLKGFSVPVLIDPKHERSKARMHEILRAQVKSWPTDGRKRRHRSIPRYVHLFRTHSQFSFRLQLSTSISDPTPALRPSTSSPASSSA